MFGPSKPNLASIQALELGQKGVFPAGLAAANALGFTTQNPARVEVATTRSSLPKLFVGKTTIVHTRRPVAWNVLSKTDGALLDLLRRRGESSELSPEQCIAKLLEFFREKGRIARLFEVAVSEPPRVRAMLGAIGEELGYSRKALAKLRRQINPLSRFEFGRFRGLAKARNWQAKDRVP